MKNHPITKLLPLLDGRQFDQLVEDIRAHGLREPIVVTKDNLLLDGRNRIKACRRAKVKPRFKTYKGHDPLAYVLSMNVHRRHLTPSQRAMIAVRLVTGDGKPGRKTIGAQAPISGIEAAKKLQVSSRSVRRAQVIQNGTVRHDGQVIPWRREPTPGCPP